MKNITSMNKHGVFNTFIFLLLCSGCGQTDESATDSIKALGGIIISDDTGNVIRVNFSGSMIHDLSDRTISDAGLVYLKGLTNLTKVDLGGTNISDAGLVHLKELTNLTTLNLYRTDISDAGLVYLKELTNLTILFLVMTDISDAGLVHLKELTRLTLLWLFETKVTKEGVMKLKAAIPDCWINHESVFT